VSKSVEVHT